MRSLVALLLLILSACASTMSVPDRDILLIAHRGASGERPEHTLAAYELAIVQGADFIEPDLVITRDGVLVARHENEIGGTTDVADRPEFANRRTTKMVDGEEVTGWFAEDFSLAELKSLRARERLPALRGTDHDGRYSVPTFAEVIDLAQKRGVGIYPETKHPTYFRALGLALEERLVAALGDVGWNRADAPVFIQSFEVENLKALSAMTDVPLVQLVGDPRRPPADSSLGSYAEMLTPKGLAEIATYAVGLGPNKALVVQDDGPTGLVEAAHAAGLKVHPWTFRAEQMFVAPRFRTGQPGDMAREICAHVEAGVDGIFAD
ncbi:MAG: glycerophosphodiester phosphodiesterase, partial [Pacificimonas sp.]